MSTSDRTGEDRSTAAVLADARRAIDAVMAGDSAPGDRGPDSAVSVGFADVWKGGRGRGDGTAGQTVDGEPSAAAGSGAAAEPDALPGAVNSDDPEYMRAKKRALNMLAARDHAVAELRSKLLATDHPSDVVDVLLDRLSASGLLDDEAFAAGFVRARRESRALSVRALRLELARKGVPESAVAAAVDGIDDEFDLAYGVALKKARSTAGLPAETRLRRTLAMLARRGFPHSVSMAAARQALEEA